MIQQQFANTAITILEPDDNVIGLAVAGSWLSNEMDEFSDLDLVLVTRQKVSGDKAAMLDYAKRLGDLLSGFTGEHVGEPRLLICLYDNPLLHVDIKFLTLDEFDKRIETPLLLLDKDRQLEKVINNSTAKFPYPSFQWIEDRFWTWVHYMLAKIGRGEYFEAHDAFGLLRMYIFGPLLHMKNGSLPRAVRKVETELATEDLDDLKSTLTAYDKRSLLNSLRNSVSLYRKLRTSLFDDKVQLQQKAEQRVMLYFDEIENRK
jgi:hypothetical protein